ncbi:MAG: hypothetical protein M1834_006180 [Cirrosporium novae-zelandiae]|nr:MAG: hypothetical protein M1834_006180 [Cirrosporium novae-zelandiae]
MEYDAKTRESFDFYCFLNNILMLVLGVAPYSTGDKTSFAFVSARDRWPIIITGAIDDVHRAVGEITDPAKHADGKRIIEKLATLKYEVQHDRQLTPLEDDGESDVEDYNKELAARGNPTWFDVSWLYSECYLYRRINTFFTLSTYWKSYDVFSAQKISTFRSSRPAVLELAARYKELSEQLTHEASSEHDKAAEELLFDEMCEICLWGNATDLSLLTSLTYDDIQKLQGSQARKDSEKNILVNDLPAAYHVLKSLQKSNPSTSDTDLDARRVDIILDNAGFELYVDLILAGFLLASNLATSVVLHPKSMPWFVSDVLPGDFSALLNALADPQTFYSSPSSSTTGTATPPGTKTPPLTPAETSSLQFLFQQWSTYHSTGRLLIRPNRFWTTAHTYWRLPHLSPSLHKDLQSSVLVIFKGDLNYRKLVCDADWDVSVPFNQGCGPLGEKGSGIRVLALRTCKADTVVGLPRGRDEELRGGKKEREWSWSGKWAVVQFWDGKEEA